MRQFALVEHKLSSISISIRISVITKSVFYITVFNQIAFSITSVLQQIVEILVASNDMIDYTFR